MWMIPPKLLCRNHLLGEHSEIHKHRHNFEKGHSVAGRVSLGQIEPASMEVRHDELVEEMLRRGYKHASPYFLPDISYLPPEHQHATVDKHAALKDLHSRCKDCESLYRKDLGI